MEAQITTSKSNYGRLLTFTFTCSFNPVSLGGVSKCLDWIVRVVPPPSLTSLMILAWKNHCSTVSNDDGIWISSLTIWILYLLQTESSLPTPVFWSHGVAVVSVSMAQRQDFGKPRAAMPVEVHSLTDWKLDGFFRWRLVKIGKLFNCYVLLCKGRRGDIPHCFLCRQLVSNWFQVSLSFQLQCFPF